MSKNSPQDLYQQAYTNHYNIKNYKKAYTLYNMLIREYPDSKEANWASEQIDNIKNMPFFSEHYETDANELEKEIEIEKEKISQQEKEFDERLSKVKNSELFLITSGFNFEGYAIKKYLGVIAGETVLGTGIFSEFDSSISDFLGVESSGFSEKLLKAREGATKKLIERANKLAANAIIGLDFDYVTFGKNMIGVIANGTAVYIEPISL